MDPKTHFELGSFDEKWFCDRNFRWPFNIIDGLVSGVISTESTSDFMWNIGKKFSFGWTSLREITRSTFCIDWPFKYARVTSHLSEAKILIDQTNLDVLTISETHLRKLFWITRSALLDINFYEEIIVEKLVEQYDVPDF